MLKCVCRIVLLAALVTSAGCYSMHGLEPSGAGPVDAGSPRVDGGARPLPLDAGPPRRDASLPLMCPVVAADALCGFLPMQAGIRQTLPLTFDTCACCARTECDVRVDPASLRIELTTTLCPDPCDCDTCEAPTVECALPPLPPGEWRVSINGAPAFEVPFVEGSIEATPPLCVTRAVQDECRPSSVFGVLEPWRAGSLCAAAASDSFAPSKIEVFGDCAPCAFLQGPCTASMSERLTDDLPPGADLYVDVQMYPTTCDVDCPAICQAGSQTCITPRLQPGHFYRVFTDEGALIGSFVAGSGERGCAAWRRD